MLVLVAEFTLISNLWQAGKKASIAAFTRDELIGTGYGSDKEMALLMLIEMS